MSDLPALTFALALDLALDLYDASMPSRALVVIASVLALGCSKKDAPSSASTASSACPAGMSAIPAGTFAMGTNDGADLERPAHDVTVAAFCMDTTEVTVAAYASCASCKPATASVDWPDITEAERAFFGAFCNAGRADRATHPINCVDWSQASAYCAAQGKRLPNEDEWEYAARGGSEQRAYPWGDAPPGPALLNGCGSECLKMMTSKGKPWTAMYDADDGFPETAPVASFPKGASRWGVQDLAGNVWEWIADVHCPYGKKDCGEAKRNDRGGGWINGNAPAARGAYRHGCLPQQRVHNLGFRCVK
jgi:formylglycine-generating enzyme required for sulfatase activity